ncbi:tetratricopeptide repeat protein [Paracoccus siganidrum]|uniref:Uncharacterized protein n=1 Tax=Paracoccus siganidrum TaxID=1276757 RepID=A0A419A777_9RHOB|nr:tetratricopeptide repeat protein [Paracoccus siganidrum]RJL15309.1 hypothetical protein D3P05_10900 [Paracoccus siganidrum]RMC39370.1 hypothetical protein C9E82_05185 [Paracoccus siganidrum]
MSALPAIIGFRKDRIGARLIGLLNILRLGRKFGLPARYVWLSEPGGPYPELVDPREFLEAGFVADHIAVVDRAPDLSGRTDLMTLAPTINDAHMARRLAGGELFFSDIAFDVLHFMGEPAPEARAGIAAIAADLPLAPRLARALARAENRLSRLVPGGLAQASAIHMRRGDLLDGDPWSLGAWPAKYVPDEFFRAWAAGQEGAVIVFTDTPAAAHHMAAGDRRIVPIDRLLDLEKLTATERDMLELLLMARCRRIGGPGGSAFSRAAASLGSAEIVMLPQQLPTPRRGEAYQALLDRAIEAPDSFLAPGDLAQSLHYAARHAIAQGQAGRLAEALEGQGALMAAHPFVRRIHAECLLAAGQQDRARAAAQDALADPRLVGRDQRLCRGVLSVMEARAAPDSGDVAEQFLAAVFSQPAGENAQTAHMAAMLLGRDGPVAQALMFPPALTAGLLERNEAGLSLLAPWFYLADWEELLDDEAARRPLLAGPAMHLKLRRLGPAPREADHALTEGTTPPPPASEIEAQRIGLGAAILSLHGRYARALRILHWLDDIRPGDPLVKKRLADTCFRLGNVARAEDFLAEALELAGKPPLLQVSMARRLAAMGRPIRARNHIRMALKQWPDSGFLKRQGRRVRRTLAEAASDGPGEGAAAG